MSFWRILTSTQIWRLFYALIFQTEMPQRGWIKMQTSFFYISITIEIVWQVLWDSTNICLRNKCIFTSSSSSCTVALNNSRTDWTLFKWQTAAGVYQDFICGGKLLLGSEIWIMNALLWKWESFCWWIAIFYLVKQVSGQHLGKSDIPHVSLGVIFETRTIF